MSKYFITRFFNSDPTWDFVRKNRKAIFEFFDKGYIETGLGHFMGCDGSSSLAKNANCLKIAISDDKWVAMSVYTGYNGGYKCVGITATTDPLLRSIGKDAVKDIIKEDIGLTMDFWWCECDGVVEHWYKKFGGVEIPSVYAHCFFKNTKNKPELIDGDMYGYYRSFGNSEENRIRRKVIFGFNSKETYDLVIKSGVVEVNDILKNVGYRKLNESESLIDQKLKIAHDVIGCFYELRYDDGWYDLPDNAIDALTDSVGFIRKSIKDHKCPDYLIHDMEYMADIGEEIIDSSTHMVLHKF